MIGNGQGQKVGENATAIQAGGDVNIGASVSEVMSIVSQSIQVYTDAARAQVNDRLAEFEARLTDKFCKGNPASVSALADPDMQGALLDAQKAYARSASTDLHSVLTDLVYKRANESGSSRIALVLNDAISKSNKLTKVDLANLAFIFYVMNVGVIGNCSTDFISLRLRSHLEPLLPYLDFSTEALEYLHSQGLLLIGPADVNLNPHPLATVLKTKYAEAFNSGFTMEEIEALHPSIAVLRLSKSIQPSKFDSSKFYIPINEAGINKMAITLEGLAGLGEKYRLACRKRLVADEVMIEEVNKYFPDFHHLCKIYGESRVGVTKLSSTAISIAHAYLSKESPFSGELSIWIKG
jgi:hypothetical protein